MSDLEPVLRSMEGDLDELLDSIANLRNGIDFIRQAIQ